MVSNWNEVQPHLQKFIDKISESGPCKLVLLGGAGLFYQAKEVGKENKLDKRPPTDDADYVLVNDTTDIFDLAEYLNVPNQPSGVLYHNNIDHDVFDPTFTSGADSDTYRKFEKDVINGRIEPILRSENQKVGLYFDVGVWKLIKEASNRPKDRSDLKLLEEIGY